MFYSLTPRQTSSVNLLMICSMVARYAPPISYNFLNLISLGKKKETIFEKKMGNIDDAVPFFGENFNKIYPLIMVVYTVLVASNFFDRIISFFGNWKIFKFQTEADDLDGFDSSGLLILQKERTWIEQGRKVGEAVIPLARNFIGPGMDLEIASNGTDRVTVEMKATSSLHENELKESSTASSEARRYSGHREAISNKYAAIREQNRNTDMKPVEDPKASLLDASNSQATKIVGGPSSSLASKWATMKSGFQTLKTNIGAKKFLPLRQVEDPKPIPHVSSPESLDDIFQRLKRPNAEEGIDMDV